ncbi:MAG TPA: DUF4136 domain-containing protein [Gemmatimonadales bacterium]|jgi:hypothetical protein
MNTTLIPRPVALAAMAGAAALIASCSSVSVQSDRDASVPVPSGATWAWRASHGEPGEDRITDQRLRRFVADEMGAKGFHMVDDASQATLLVDYHHTLQNHREVVREVNAPGAVYCGVRFCRPGWGWGLYGPPEVWYRQYNYREGRLVIDIEDRASGKLAWQAVGTREIDQRLSDKDLQREVRSVLRDLPS